MDVIRIDNMRDTPNLETRVVPVIAEDCPNTSFYGTPGVYHDHRYYYLYATYRCPVCQSFGRMLIDIQMICSVVAGNSVGDLIQ